MTGLLGIADKVRTVAGMGRAELVSEWEAQFGAPPPPKLRTELMRPVLVYRIQENAFGLSGPKRKGHVQPLPSDTDRRQFKTGTKIIREWKGHLHEVAVTTDGYLYKGGLYKSLSPIAFRITGTKWSGPASLAPNEKRAEDDLTAAEGAMRHLYAQVLRRRPRAVFQLFARPA